MESRLARSGSRLDRLFRWLLSAVPRGNRALPPAGRGEPDVFSRCRAGRSGARTRPRQGQRDGALSCQARRRQARVRRRRLCQHLERVAALALASAHGCASGRAGASGTLLSLVPAGAAGTGLDLQQDSGVTKKVRSSRGETWSVVTRLPRTGRVFPPAVLPPCSARHADSAHLRTMLPPIQCSIAGVLITKLGGVSCVRLSMPLAAS
jgi:hypothetical protein